jgi:ABC-type transport system involved in cytochrome bd biosynthesis fused ATPase/permease subunit
VKRLPLPLYFEIVDLAVIENGIELKFGDNIKVLKLYKKEKYLIRGASGHGKTTFINSLLGKYNGLYCKYGKPENFFHHYVEMHQNIKEYLPTSKVTIRQLFNNEPDDNVIIEFINLCEISDWIEYIKDLDVFILNRISGGQKTRLAIARQLYILWKMDKAILILDEPEQGSDPEIAYNIIDNIFKKFPEKMIIVISHLELIHIKYKWDNKFRIKKVNNISTFDIDE